MAADETPAVPVLAGPVLAGPVLAIPGQPFDLPTPTPNCRCTRAQNASRSHSLASW